MQDDKISKILCIIAVLMLFAIVVYNAKSSPGFSSYNTVEQQDEPLSDQDDQTSSDQSTLQEQTENDTYINDDSDEDDELYFDLNQATLEQLCKIKGIGESIATNIIEFREQNGEFSSLDELLQIKGIGQKKYQLLCEYLYVE